MQLANPWHEDGKLQLQPDEEDFVIDRGFIGELRYGEVSFWNGSMGLSDKRMRFWGGRLEDLARVKYLKDETRMWAERGVGGMSDVFTIFKIFGCL